ncbi:MAG TPA: NAD(P)H-dependent glycerol-3-phosphate dehydrogenase [Candidatus Binatia bacterium]|nr:NAD(P)H-dependent glycerol-3-phosphate dehydrogenase [Candidatus Binatia bacterium]
MMAKVAVVGAGAWGTALAAHACRLHHEVRLWAREPQVVEAVNERQENTLFLPGITLPVELDASTDLAAVVSGADLVILVPPAQHLREVSTAAAQHIGDEAVVAVAAKGIEESRLALMSEVIAETLPAVLAERLAFLSGPTFAREVASGLPTDVVAASRGMTAARKLQPWLHSPTFRVYSSDDPIGVEVGGALKNVIAVAAGACDGLGLGNNARAALITRGLAEITRLGVALGADPLTFLGMAGVGDLVLTCTGDQSRNRTLGMKVAAGFDPEAYLAAQRSVAEGFYTAVAAHDLARKKKIDMPITEQVYQVLHHRRPLLEALRTLLEREYKEELRGIRE